MSNLSNVSADTYRNARQTEDLIALLNQSGTFYKIAHPMAKALEDARRGMWSPYVKQQNEKIDKIQVDKEVVEAQTKFFWAQAQKAAASLLTTCVEGGEGLVERVKADPLKFFKESRSFWFKEVLPGALLTLGAPLAVYYGIKVAYESYKNSIGRPKLAIRQHQPTGVAYAVTSRIRSVWNKILGRKPSKVSTPVFHSKLLQRIDEFVKAIRCTIKNKGYFQNILFYGPGGVGKTMVAEKIAKDANVNFVMMSGGDLAQYIKRGEHVTELNKLFDAAERSSLPTVIFIDEAEGLCLNRKLPQSQEHIELLNAFLNRTGTQSKKIILILATNRKEDFDEAVLTRMDHKVLVPLPGLAERTQIIGNYLPEFFDAKTIQAVFTKAKVDQVARSTEGFPGRILFKMLNVMAGKKTSSEDNKLTDTMIDQTVADFVEQETEEALPPSKASLPKEVAVVVRPAAAAGEKMNPVSNPASNLTLGLNSKQVGVAAAPAA